MRLLLQRVRRAGVEIDGSPYASIGPGILLLAGFGREDQPEILPAAVDKLVNLRVFPDSRGQFQYSLRQTSKSILVVPQFTLYAGTASGRRPDFVQAMEPGRARDCFIRLCELLEQQPLEAVKRGKFGADMQVELVNDGPVTLMLEF